MPGNYKTGSWRLAVSITWQLWARSWLAKFETAKVGDGFIARARFDVAAITANPSA
jgi:hypothetical protein